MRYYFVLFSLLTAFPFWRITDAREIMKCLTSTREKIRISCPHGHMIYKPSIFAGASLTQTCARTEHDCTGVPKGLQRRVENCFWKKACYVRFGQNETITCNNSGGQHTRNISYVVIEKSHCIPREFVHNVCHKGKLSEQGQLNGVIRSHRTYPWKRPRSREPCKAYIPLSKHNSLVMQVLRYHNIPADSLRITAIQRNGCEKRVSLNDLIIVHGNTTKSINIVADFRWKRRQLNGFSLSYSAYRSRSFDKFLQFPESARPALKELGWIFEVRPVIEQCATTENGRFDLICAKDEVVYFPAVSATGHTRRDSKCSFKSHDCGGMTPGLLVQANNCYWKNTCSFDWQGSDRIVLSSQRTCIGYMASTIGISGHRCIHRDNIYDICANFSDVIDAPWGVIRSHPLYPWFIDNSCKMYKRTITIGSRHALTLAIQDMNLDPDGRDKFHVYHVTGVDRRVVLNTASAKEGAHVHVKEGKVIVKYERFEWSKSGRGFVLVFYRFAITRQEAKTALNVAADNNNGLVSDAASTMPTHLSNWRLCSKRGKGRRQGRSCNKRVWTDYYTRLE